ncbi:hypothetical protein [Bacteroides sp.]|nr:hypothetical protein [Bacteroides sp.]
MRYRKSFLVDIGVIIDKQRIYSGKFPGYIRYRFSFSGRFYL